MPVTASVIALGRPNALPPAAEARRSAARQITAFLRGFSVGAVAPGFEQIAALKSALPPHAKVHLAAVAARPYSETIEAAVRLRAQGLEPVPHLAARDVESRAALEDMLTRLARWAGVRRMLVVGGDAHHTKGPFGGARELIESGLLQRAGIVEIAVAGYPEGHPRLPQEGLDRTLAAKIETAEQTGLRVSIVTQLCFDSSAILRFVGRLRDLGIENPVRIGMAGPADLSSLIRLARRCGVRATAQSLTRHAGLTKQRLAAGSPDRVIRPLAEAAAGSLGRIKAHFFAPGDAAATARWAAAAAAGWVAPDPCGGFTVLAPEHRAGAATSLIGACFALP
ncbi:MAG: methylenetetrahydrofolate reductase [Xanthobacteraceae bacterium]|nr:methylenetetrahydrofolate reductase [Xanthobacteraceae bacterium]